MLLPYLDYRKTGFCGGKLVGKKYKPSHHPFSKIRYLIERKISRKK